MIKQECRLHIKYNKNISIILLNDILANITKAINDINRQNGIGNKIIGNYAPVINGVDKGSIIFDVVLFLATEIGLPILVSYISNRINKKKENDIKVNVNINTNENVNVIVSVDNNSERTINIEINN